MRIAGRAGRRSLIARMGEPKRQRASHAPAGDQAALDARALRDFGPRPISFRSRLSGARWQPDAVQRIGLVGAYTRSATTIIR